MSEGSLFFEGKGAVQESLRRIAQRLNELGIPYAIAGGMALFHHGYRRFTEDIDILVTRESLKAIHQALDGRGYVRPFARSKNLRDVDSRVKIEFLIAGEFPGDGKPKAVSFPDPPLVAIELDGIKFVRLAALVELKLASGLTGSDRMKDLADVQELIKLLNLSRDFSEEVDKSVREKYLALWQDARGRVQRYLTVWQNPFSTKRPAGLSELIETLRQRSLHDANDSLRQAIQLLEAMQADGVTLATDMQAAEGEIILMNNDPLVAAKYAMVEESEFFGD